MEPAEEEEKEGGKKTNQREIPNYQIIKPDCFTASKKFFLQRFPRSFPLLRQLSEAWVSRGSAYESR